MPTTVVRGVTDISAIYDRIYDIADRLFKKYNPCNICVENNKAKCINRRYRYNHLCCGYYDDRCKYWENGCTVKSLSCKLFVCSEILYGYDKNRVLIMNKKYRSFVHRLKWLENMALKYGLSSWDYYITKKETLRRRTKGDWD